MAKHNQERLYSKRQPVFSALNFCEDKFIVPHGVHCHVAFEAIWSFGGAPGSPKESVYVCSVHGGRVIKGE